MIFWCQSCGEQHTQPHVTSANITTCAKCGGSSFATWRPNQLQSLSQEAVRDEVLTKVLKLPRSVFNDESTNTTREYIAAADIAALKREPNAAGPGEIAHAMSMADNGPAPAAPDVADYPLAVRADYPLRGTEKRLLALPNVRCYTTFGVQSS